MTSPAPQGDKPLAGHRPVFGALGAVRADEEVDIPAVVRELSTVPGRAEFAVVRVGGNQQGNVGVPGFKR